MRTKAWLLVGALGVILAGGVLLGVGAAAAQSPADAPPLLIRTDDALTGVSSADGTVLWYLDSQGMIPFSPYAATVNPDRSSLLLAGRFEISGMERLNLFRVELPAPTVDTDAALAALTYDGYRGGFFVYSLTPDQSAIVAVAGRDLVVRAVGRLAAGEAPPDFTLDTWLLPDQVAQRATIQMDPLARHAYVRIDLAARSFGYPDYVALWVDLADLTAQPVETDLAWVSWSPDGVYLATFAPGEGLVMRDGGSLAALPWSADLTAPLEAHSFIWGVDGQTAYYRTGPVDNPTVHRVDLAAGAVRLLTADLASFDGSPLLLGGGGQAALFDIHEHPMSGNVAALLDLNTGEWLSEVWPVWGGYALAASPTRDFFLALNGSGIMAFYDLYAWREGVELTEDWVGPVVLHGWTADGLPILQTLSTVDRPIDYNAHADRVQTVPGPGWYIFDVTEDGRAIWTALPCPDCAVTPAGFPKVRLSVQRPDGAPVFAVLGTGPEGEGVYVVDLVAGTARLVFSQAVAAVRQVDWLAAGSLPLESAPTPTHDPAQPVD